jgi:hypothetical protein
VRFAGATSGEDRARAWGTRITLLAYALALCVLPLLEADLARPRSTTPVVLADVDALLDFLARLAGAGAWQVLRYVPLGFLAALAVVPRDSLRRRWRALGALALGCALAVGVRVVELGQPYGPPAPIHLTLPAAGVAIGTWMGATWIRGWAARATLVPKLAVGVVVGVLLLAGSAVALYMLAMQTEPARGTQVVVTSEDKRRLHRLLAGKSPQRVEPGGTETLRLTERDLRQLLAWAAEATGREHGVDIDLEGQRATVQASVGLPDAPLGRRFVNLVVEGLVEVRDGALSVRPDRLRIGRVRLPVALVQRIADQATALARQDPRAEPLLAAVRKLSVGEDAVEVTYGRLELPDGFLAEVFAGDASVGALVPSVRAQVQGLLAAVAGWPEGDARFLSAVQVAFRRAAERSSVSDPVAENRAALIALGMTLGSARLEGLVGDVVDDATRARIGPVLGTATIFDRDDWPKHFLVSAGLAAISSEAASNQMGLFKEELDAGGGSGFSFTDIAADRAGVLFASAATRDADAAVAMQDRLRFGFGRGDVFPEVRDLPEFLSDGDFQARFGGVGGPGYQDQLAEIERRLAGCPGLK